MHSFSVALLPQDVVDVRGVIGALISSYCLETEMEPYKAFYLPEHAAAIAKGRGAGEDLDLLVRLLQDEGWGDFGVESGRLYSLSTYNLEGKWDYWGVGGFYDRKVYNEATAQVGQSKGWDENLCANVCLVSLLSADVIPATIITPEGEWHDCEDFGWRLMNPIEAKEKAWAAWEVHARQLLQRYSDHLAVGLDIHS